jgi:hypothetical protein
MISLRLRMRDSLKRGANWIIPTRQEAKFFGHDRLPVTSQPIRLWRRCTLTRLPMSRYVNSLLPSKAIRRLRSKCRTTKDLMRSLILAVLMRIAIKLRRRLRVTTRLPSLLSKIQRPSCDWVYSI